MGYVHRVSMLKCTHPAVEAIWETGGMSMEDKIARCFIHIVTTNDKRFDVEYLNGDGERSAIKKIEEWLDETYPALKGKRK